MTQKPIKEESGKMHYAVAGHEDDVEFLETFRMKLLHSFCDPG